MTLNEFIIKLDRLREQAGHGDMPVWVEVNHQQEKCGNYHFSTHWHYHEENVYNGILQKEISEIIIMPEPDWVEEEIEDEGQY